jgi:hypothetical protein
MVAQKWKSEDQLKGVAYDRADMANDPQTEFGAIGPARTDRERIRVRIGLRRRLRSAARCEERGEEKRPGSEHRGVVEIRPCLGSG